MCMGSPPSVQGGQLLILLTDLLPLANKNPWHLAVFTLSPVMLQKASRIAKFLLIPDQGPHV